jgi:hypothetical protein
MDRFFRGLVAGIAGGVAMNIWSAFAYYILKLPIRRFIDWAGIVLYGDYPHTVYESLFALLMQILWVGLLGVIFAYMIFQATSRGYLIKGAFFGIISGFFIYAIPTLLGSKHLATTSFTTVISNHFGGLIWGLTTAQTVRWLDNKFVSETIEYERKFTRYHVVPSPVRKLSKRRNTKRP